MTRRAVFKDDGTDAFDDGVNPVDIQAAAGIPDPAGGSDADVITVDAGAYILAPPTGGTTPTGTGFPHVTVGVQDAAAKLVEIADVAASLKPSGTASGTDESLRRLGTGSTHAAAGDDSRFPTAGEKNALAGTSGTPGSLNKYVTDGDSRMTDTRTPAAHKTSHEDGGSDEISIQGLAGTSVELANHLADTVDAHDASAISFSPTGTIAATDVQAAIAEVASEATGAVSSVFGRTGAVVAVSGDYAGVVNAFLSGATAASRYVGATASGAPASGTFLKGDFVIAQDGKIFVCTAAGSPGTWADVSAGAAVGYATPAIVLGSSAAAGAAATVIRSDATIAAFDATSPSTQAFGDAAAVGTAAFAARRDHKHAMPAAPTTIANDTAWNTKGDIAVATAADTATVLGVGTNDYALMADSSQATGLIYKAPVTRVRAFATPTSGAGLDIQAPANYKLVDFNIFAAQTSAANTAMNIIITYSDATTDQLATTASQVACLNGNDGGAIRTVSGGYSASQTFQTKDVTRIQVLGVGAGAGSRVAVASALQVRI